MNFMNKFTILFLLKDVMNFFGSSRNQISTVIIKKINDTEFNGVLHFLCHPLVLNSKYLR